MWNDIFGVHGTPLSKVKVWKSPVNRGLTWGGSEDYEIVVKTLNTGYSIWIFSIWIFPDIVFVLFRSGHFHNVVSTFTNVVKLDVENDNVLSMLSNVVHVNIEIHNVVSMLIWRCPTLSQTTLKCLLGYCYNRVIKLFWSYQSIINWSFYVILIILV